MVKDSGAAQRKPALRRRRREVRDARLGSVADEAVRSVPDDGPDARRRRLSAAPAASVFALLTIAGALWQSAGRHLVSPPLDVVDLAGARVVDIAAGEWWRLASAAFVSSAGWPHAGLNVVGTWLTGRPLERERGTRVAVVVFSTSAVAAFAAGAWGHGVRWLSAGGSGVVLG